MRSAGGGCVILRVHSVPTLGSRESAILNIFRPENGKVVEHWACVKRSPSSRPIPNDVWL